MPDSKFGRKRAHFGWVSKLAVMETQPKDGGGEKLLPLTMKTFEIGVILLVHANDVEEAQRTLESCIPPDLRVEAKQVQYCEENIARFTLN